MTLQKRKSTYLISTSFIVLSLMLCLPAWSEIHFSYSLADGIGPEEGVMRRDPSDVIRVGDLDYVWYSKGKVAHGYDATIWFATSNDGHQWTEQGEALKRGPKGSWDEQSVFTPNILIAEGKYWLFYTAVPKPFSNEGDNITKTAIGIAVSSSPDGPWEKLENNPILSPSEDPKEFDSLRVDDASLIVREGEIWLYYKGRQWNNTPAHTKMGLAIAKSPEGPYQKYEGNPVIQGGHEVLVWPSDGGVVAMITHVGPEGIRDTLQYAEDGIHFQKMDDLTGRVPKGPGIFRSDSFVETNDAFEPQWGIHIWRKDGFLPSLDRFDVVKD
ncbi:MAG: family 43 glycosylhydrolase [Candidatus Omnitrophica bacterium]|nr:family 43 glycosylhydrolase [Candidatus Omnitrophota bacterium]MCB9784304.1 family 43 glycosylhydrolase [Candidatus Omnitrophota bacterium]